MSGRESEAVMLDRCRGVATRGAEGASDQREANVFRLAAMLVRARQLRAAQEDRGYLKPGRVGLRPAG